MRGSGANDDDDTPTSGQSAAIAGQRLDKWLWYARVTKSRTVASLHIEKGRIRVNRARVEKPSHVVRPGDVVTASVASGIRVLKILAPGIRRGPAKEAQLLYEELTPVDAPGAGRRLAQAGARGATELTGRTAGPDAHGDGARDQDPPVPVSDPAGDMGRPNKKERRQLRRLKGTKGE